MTPSGNAPPPPAVGSGCRNPWRTGCGPSPETWADTRKVGAALRSVRCSHSAPGGAPFGKGALPEYPLGTLYGNRQGGCSREVLGVVGLLLPPQFPYCGTASDSGSAASSKRGAARSTVPRAASPQFTISAYLAQHGTQGGPPRPRSPRPCLETHLRRPPTTHRASPKVLAAARRRSIFGRTLHQVDKIRSRPTPKIGEHLRMTNTLSRE